MIKLIRLDERLIHGQVAIKWSRHLDVDRIVVANDEASKDSMIQKTLLMAAPSTTKVAIKDVESSIKLLNDPRMVDVSALVIVSNIEDLLKICREVSIIPKVNIGNYGRVAHKEDNKQRSTYGRNLYLYDSERDLLEELLELNIPTVYQTTPEDAPEKLEKVINKGGK